VFTKEQPISTPNLKHLVQETLTLKWILEANVCITDGAGLYLNRMDAMGASEEILQGSRHLLEILLRHLRDEVGNGEIFINLLHASPGIRSKA
jgi:hypothetical protein